MFICHIETIRQQRFHISRLLYTLYEEMMHASAVVLEDHLHLLPPSLLRRRRGYLAKTMVNRD